MDKIKEMFSKDKKTSNLILVVILLVVLLIFMNYLFNDKDVSSKAKQVISENVESTDSTETRLANIICKIEGVETASVMINYSSSEKVIPVYDTKENTDTTNENNKTSSKKTVEKTVAYENGGKTALLESTEQAETTGAIVVVTGSVTEDVGLEIKEAVSMVTNVPLHKVQIFIN